VSRERPSTITSIIIPACGFTAGAAEGSHCGLCVPVAAEGVCEFHDELGVAEVLVTQLQGHG
jgi:hypothetical protein